MATKRFSFALDSSLVGNKYESQIDEYETQYEIQLERENQAKNLGKTEKEITEEVKKQSRIMRDNLRIAKENAKYEKASLSGKKQMLKDQVDTLKASKEELSIIIKTLEKERNKTKDAERRNEINKQLKEYRSSINRIEKEMETRQERVVAMEKEILRASTSNVSLKEKQAVLEDRAARAREIYFKYEKDIKRLEKEGKKEEVEKLKSDRKKELESAGLKGYDRFGRQSIFSSLKQDKENNLNKEGIGAALSEGLDSFLSSGKISSAISSVTGSLMPAFSAALSPVISIISSVLNVVGKINKTLDKGVEEAISIQNSYLGKINSRLQGTDQSYGKYIEYIKNTLGYSSNTGQGLVSAFISQKSLIENIGKLVDQGVAYNVEERATLMTLSDRMVSTFDVLNPTLERLVRLQQNDVTSSQLGYEALLTRFLNENFNDTSYLNSLYDTISSSLLDASSQLTASASTEFNYAVQKWLASLYSLGMSESGVQKIATGIGYLSTGNVEALNSDDGLRTLFAAASGGAYSSILTNGLNAGTVNDLLKNIVIYLQSIAGDTNKVTKQALAGVFGGFDLSDLRAVTNLTTENLEKIYASNYSYSRSLKEVVNQLEYVMTTTGDTNNQRTSLASIYDTVFDNIVFSFGLSKTTDPTGNAYSTWKKADILGNLGGTFTGVIADLVKFFTSTSEFGSMLKSAWAGFTTSGNASAWANQFKSSDFYTKLYSDAMQTRGSSYSYESLLSGNTVSGISSMAKIGVSNTISGTESDLASLNTTSAAAASKSTVSGTETTRDISALYAELFERQTTAMKVSINSIDYNAASTLSNIITNNVPQTTNISSISDSALNALSNSMHVDTVDEINNKLSGTLEVSMNDNFLEQINTGLSYARGI